MVPVHSIAETDACGVFPRRLRELRLGEREPRSFDDGGAGAPAHASLRFDGVRIEMNTGSARKLDDGTRETASSRGPARRRPDGGLAAGRSMMAAPSRACAVPRQAPHHVRVNGHRRRRIRRDVSTPTSRRVAGRSRIRFRRATGGRVHRRTPPGPSLLEILILDDQC